MNSQRPSWEKKVRLGSLRLKDLDARVRIDDAQRLAALRRYEILDTAPEAEYETVAEMLRDGCRVPMAAIAFVDGERMWMKAQRGFASRVIPRSLCFCSVAMHSSTPTIVEDAWLDQRFRDNPLVVGEPGVRFYAGFPLFSGDGYGMGAVCVVGLEPRTLRLPQIEFIRKARDWVQASLALCLLCLRIRDGALDRSDADRESDREIRKFTELKKKLSWASVEAAARLAK